MVEKHHAVKLLLRKSFTADNCSKVAFRDAEVACDKRSGWEPVLSWLRPTDASMHSIMTLEDIRFMQACGADPGLSPALRSLAEMASKKTMTMLAFLPRRNSWTSARRDVVAADQNVSVHNVSVHIPAER